MEALTRLVTESLARHGFDRPLDYRRLQWSRWFRCESHHSLLFVPSKPGVFAIAEEVTDLPATTNHATADAFVRPPVSSTNSLPSHNLNREGHNFSRAVNTENISQACAADGNARRMLAVTQFFEDDDMAFVLDRMLSRQNPMQARLISGRYFVRFVVIEDQIQRRSICNALNQWIVNSAEKSTGIGSHFATSLELTPQTEYVANDAQRSLFENEENEAHVQESVGRTLLSVTADSTQGLKDEYDSEQSKDLKQAAAPSTPLPTRTTPQPDPGAATNIHCPPIPSGF
jgi:hypothetical protein